MYEYEIKLPITAPEDLAARLAALGFEKAGTIREEDSYYNHPERDLKQAGLHRYRRGAGHLSGA